MKKVETAMLGITLGLCLGACGGDDDAKQASSPADTKLARDVIAKTKECKIYTGPAANSVNDTVQDDFDRCVGECFLKAPCEELKLVTCSIKAEDAPVALCIQGCSTMPKDGFACDDGTMLAHLFVCDGFQHCFNAEDERDCMGFTCANGQATSHDEAKCDGTEDCPDGSDELDCPDVCR